MAFLAEKKSVKRKIILIFLSVISFSVAFSQKQVLTGKVVDAFTKAPLAFVNVSIEGSTQGSVSDIDGLFFVTVFQGTRKINFSYIGLENREKLL